MNTNNTTDQRFYIQYDVRSYYRNPYASGASTFYRHNLMRRVIYSEGMRDFAQEKKAYWLIDLIASHLSSQPTISGYGFVSFFCHLEAEGCLCFFTDGNYNKIGRHQEVPYTDLDTDFTCFCSFDGKEWTIYLPSEH